MACQTFNQMDHANHSGLRGEGVLRKRDGIGEDLHGQDKAY